MRVPLCAASVRRVGGELLEGSSRFVNSELHGHVCVCVQAVIHCECVRQAAQVVAMDHERLRSGECMFIVVCETEREGETVREGG